MASDYRRTPNHRTRAQTRLVVIVSLAVSQSAWAQTTRPNPPPTPPPSVTFPQTGVLGSAQCAEQYTTAINNANAAGLASNAIGAAAQVAGVTAQQTAAAARATAFQAIATTASTAATSFTTMGTFLNTQATSLTTMGGAFDTLTAGFTDLGAAFDDMAAFGAPSPANAAGIPGAFAASVGADAAAAAEAVASGAVGAAAASVGAESVAADALAAQSTAQATAAQAISGVTTAEAAALATYAVGAGSTVSVGAPGSERRITNVAAGISPTDAVNVSQLSSLSASLQSQIGGVQTEARRGIAAAVAANGYTTPVRPGGTTVGLSGGFFHGESALGFSVAHRVAALPSAVVYGSYANSAGAENVYKVGAAYEF